MMMRIFVLITLLLSLNSCFFFSSFQSAKMLDKQELEISGSAAVYAMEEFHFPEELLIQYGFQFGYGFSKKFNLRSRSFVFVEHFITDSSTYTGAFPYFDIEPKIALGKRERAALTFPVGVSLMGLPMVTTMPTLLLSAHTSKTACLNLGIKTEFSLFPEPYPIPMPGITLGATFMPDDAPMVITPEIAVFLMDGLMINAGVSVGGLVRKHGGDR